MNERINEREEEKNKKINKTQLTQHIPPVHMNNYDVWGGETTTTTTKISIICVGKICLSL